MSAEIRSMAIFVDAPADVADVRWFPASTERPSPQLEYVVPARVIVNLGDNNSLHLAPEAAATLAAGILAALADDEDPVHP